jgi:hypothetical protein
MRIGVLVVLAACGSEGAGRGSIKIVTFEGARIDFMSSDAVVGGGVVGASGELEAEIDPGDRAVISIASDVIVFDQLEPGQTYYWLADNDDTFRPRVQVSVEWTEEPTATHRLLSGCGSFFGAVSPSELTVCSDVDDVFVTAERDGEVVGIAHQQIDGATADQLVTIASLAPPRTVEVSIVSPPDAFFNNDSNVSLVTARNTRYFDEFDAPGARIALPDIPGDLRSFVQLFLDGGEVAQFVTLIDRRPFTDAITFDMTAHGMPLLVGIPSYDATTRTATVPVTGDEVPTAISIGAIDGERRYVVYQPYSTNPILPVLPPEIPPIPSGDVTVVLLTSSRGYADALQTIGRLEDPTFTAHSLYASGLFATSVR